MEEVLAPNIHNYQKLGVSVTVQFDEDLPLVPVDPEKIRQVILNFCNNAVEAMPKGGMLTVRGYRLNENAVLEIRDTGQGIPKDFDPFQLFKTTKPQGTGLGLSIVQQIISDHRGAVDYVSELGMGATFRVSLRLVAR